ncbi:hypothetical protein GCM10010245_79610 [Streptomyces spectabilis]|nr:hypothetical protein GCM10010245_79610 [Streptomyces spectabilis]
MPLVRKRLDDRRKAVGLSIEKLAETVGVSRSTLGRWLYNGEEPRPELRPRLAEVLGVSLELLEELLSSTADEPLSEQRNPRSVATAAVQDLRADFEELSARYDTRPSASLIPQAQQQLTCLSTAAANAQRARTRRELYTLHADATILMGALVWDASQRSDLDSAKMYYEDARGTARTLQDRALEGYALLRLAYLELYGARRPREGFELASLAARTAGPASHALAAVAHLHAAEAQAMLGEGSVCARTLTAANQHLDKASDVDAYADLLAPSPVGRLTGACYLALGQYRRAQDALTATAKQLVDRPKSRSIAQGNLALAYVGSSDVEGAVDALHAALSDLEVSRGGGGLTIAATAVRSLRRWQGQTAVADVTDRLLALMAAPVSPRSL